MQIRLYNDYNTIQNATQYDMFTSNIILKMIMGMSRIIQWNKYMIKREILTDIQI